MRTSRTCTKVAAVLVAGLAGITLCGNAMAWEHFASVTVDDTTPYPGQTVQVDVLTTMNVVGSVWSSTAIRLLESDGVSVVGGSTVCFNQPDPDLNNPTLGNYLESMNYTVPSSLADGSYYVQAVGYNTSDDCSGSLFRDPAVDDREAVTVESLADLTLTTVDYLDPATAGFGAPYFNLLYSFTVTNNGPNEATSVEFVHTPPTLPTGVTFLGDTNYYASQGTYSGDTWDVGTLAVGGNATIELRFIVGAEAAVCDTGTETCIAFGGSVDSDQTDPTPGDNLASGVTSINREYDLVLTADDTPDPTVAGSSVGNLTHQFTLSRSGPSDASGVSVAIVPSLPSGVTVYNWTESVGSFDGSTWNIPDADVEAADNGTVGTLDLVLTVDPTAAVCTDCISTTGTISHAANETDTVPGNDSDSEDTSIVREYDLALAVTDTPDPVLAGSGAGNLTHQFTLSRSGPSDATGVSVAIVPSLPGGVAVYNWSETVGSFDGSTWTIPDADVEAADNGTVGTLDIVLTVDHTADSCTDCISETGTVSYTANETDTNTANNVNISNPTSIENAADLATTFATSIDFDNDATDSVTVTLSCNAGLPLEQSFEISEGSDVIFTMTDLPFLTPGITCEITATDADGYALTAVANAGASAESCLFVAEDLAGNFERDASNSCVFTAVPAPTAITVNTMFENIPNDEIASDVDTDFETVITCQGASETAGSSFGEVQETDTTGTFTADWYADPDGGADCTVVLYPDSDAVEGDSCEFSFVVGDAEAGCDVIGTIFFEGVPVMNRYGLALMALLMLGMGFVGFRRFV